MSKRNIIIKLTDESGHSIRARVIDSPPLGGGGKFMKVWQDSKHADGWDRRLGELQGNSLLVLVHMIRVATWGNVVPGPTEVAQNIGMKQPNVSRAYAELVKVDVLQKTDKGYRLNPLFCWQGSDEQYERAIETMVTLHRASLQPPSQAGADTFDDTGRTVDPETGEIFEAGPLSPGPSLGQAEQEAGTFDDQLDAALQLPQWKKA